MIISLYINPNTSHNQTLIVTVKKKLRKKNFDLKSIKLVRGMSIQKMQFRCTPRGTT